MQTSQGGPARRGVSPLAQRSPWGMVVKNSELCVQIPLGSNPSCVTSSS